MNRESAIRQEIDELAERINVDENMSANSLILAGIALLLKRIPNMYQDVTDFHVKYGIQYDGPPRKLDSEYQKFRDARLKEEFDEYCSALTLADRMDALVDLIYIALGTAHLHGFKRFDEAWNRVHQANMQKELSHDANPGKYGKLGDKRDIVKPKGWVAPDLTDLCMHDSIKVAEEPPVKVIYPPRTCEACGRVENDQSVFNCPECGNSI